MFLNDWMDSLILDTENVIYSCPDRMNLAWHGIKCKNKDTQNKKAKLFLLSDEPVLPSHSPKYFLG